MNKSTTLWLIAIVTFTALVAVFYHETISRNTHGTEVIIEYDQPSIGVQAYNECNEYDEHEATSDNTHGTKVTIEYDQSYEHAQNKIVYEEDDT